MTAEATSEIPALYPKAQLPLYHVLRQFGVSQGLDIEARFLGWRRSSDLEGVEELAADEDIRFLHTRLLMVDLLLCWLMNMKETALLELTCRRIDDENADLSVQNTMFSFSDKFYDDLRAVRTLILRSLDAPAKVITRSFSEAIDGFFLIMSDDEARRDYFAAVTPDLANDFYFRRMAKGRPRKAFYRALAKSTQGDRPSVYAWLEREETLLGAMVHPTRAPMLSKSMFGEYLDATGVFPSISKASRRTLRFLSLRALQIAPVTLFVEADRPNGQHQTDFGQQFGLAQRQLFHRVCAKVLTLAWDFMGRAEEEKRPF